MEIDEPILIIRDLAQWLNLEREIFQVVAISHLPSSLVSFLDYKRTEKYSIAMYYLPSGVGDLLNSAWPLQHR